MNTLKKNKFILFCFSLIFFSQAHSARNEIVFESTEINEIVSPLDDKFLFNFQFKCYRDTQILNVIPSCYCVVIDEVKSNYKKDSVGGISGYINIAGKTGKDIQYVKIETTSFKEYTLKIILSINPILTIYPRLLIWKNAEIESKSVKIKLNPKYSERILNIKSVEGFEASLKKINTNDEYELIVTPKSQLSNINRTLIFEVITGDKKIKKFFISLLVK